MHKVLLQLSCFQRKNMLFEQTYRVIKIEISKLNYFAFSLERCTE